MLYKLDVETNRVKRLLILEFQKEEKKSSAFVKAMIIMAITILCAIIGFFAGAPTFGAFSVIGAIVSLMVGGLMKSNE